MTLKTRPINKKQALEYQLKLAFSIFWGLLLGLALWVMSLLSLTLLMQFTVFIFLFIPLSILFLYFYKKIITPFYSLTSLVEAIRLEDYSLRIKDHYHSGVLHALSQEIAELSDDLQQRKQVYDQHTLLIYHLIEQLETPIVIFNNQLQMSHANAAFSQYIEQPWQAKRLAKSESLGLVFKNGWQFTKQDQSECWQIKHSQFVEHEQTYHLVILSNVEELLRVNQQKSWQQIIRVLSHEIRNSLTPIKSLAQTLVSQELEETKTKQALQVMVDRSTSLQEFVNRYADITKNISINKSWFNTAEFIKTITVLFPQSTFSIESKVDKVWGDIVLLKQVLINLIKNSVEANIQNSNPRISITISTQLNRNQKSVVIEVTDNGQGISNIDNLFVPFYTTKNQGQGIGLSLSKNIIEQHDGRLTLVNNIDKQGATAKIYLSQKGAVPTS
ncbi:MAG: nitrogen fixation/metabolism regulation signal transduction histidine kinase [Glaciecola sp.]|jgi:two-component system nitrogen regulation sensor histidine kinase NtrY